MRSHGRRGRARAWMPESDPCSHGCVARPWRAEGCSPVAPGDIWLANAGRQNPRRRPRTAALNYAAFVPSGFARRARRRMSVRLPSACGYAVDNCRCGAREPVGFCVDRMALIVRNPNERDRKEAIVENRGKSILTCSLQYFLLQMKVDCSLHNPPVLTGTTTVLEFSRRWRRRKQ